MSQSFRVDSPITQTRHKIQASIPFTTILPAVHHMTGPTGQNDLALPPVPHAIELTTLLGNTLSEHMQTLHSLYVAQIATIIWNWEDEHSPGLRRSVVVGIALRKTDKQDEVSERESFFQIMEMVQKLLREG